MYHLEIPINCFSSVLQFPFRRFIAKRLERSPWKTEGIAICFQYSWRQGKLVGLIQFGIAWPSKVRFLKLESAYQVWLYSLVKTYYDCTTP